MRLIVTGSTDYGDELSVWRTLYEITGESKDVTLVMLDEPGFPDFVKQFAGYYDAKVELHTPFSGLEFDTGRLMAQNSMVAMGANMVVSFGESRLVSIAAAAKIAIYQVKRAA